MLMLRVPRVRLQSIIFAAVVVVADTYRTEYPSYLIARFSKSPIYNTLIHLCLEFQVGIAVPICAAPTMSSLRHKRVLDE